MWVAKYFEKFRWVNRAKLICSPSPRWSYGPLRSRFSEASEALKLTSALCAGKFRGDDRPRHRIEMMCAS